MFIIKEIIIITQLNMQSWVMNQIYQMKKQKKHLIIQLLKLNLRTLQVIHMLENQVKQQ